ncbi:hypothetical protein [Pseudidiomarina donghaiensis]|uniref:PEGA domain-containing protein n=1 Tax=Pseudidiomarina donghaiensis TaxID=519452 RepID=A0A432XGX9_9GAMM|nr:hypothetical protein [Pseudidiomarina donghaiensis]RUO48008.1 hypothetical protein CWE24_08465 [Pseudidiomarina donghaiensis]SFV22759.1 hypothetical protein SAMN04488139_1512 [Pseudidiomarina donghaiensis]
MKRNFLIMVAVLVTLVSLSGCAKHPTKMTTIVNDAPTVSFNVSDSTGLSLWVDGVSYGPLEQYQYPNKSVELISGEHRIEIRRGNDTIYSEQHYFSEQTHRTLEINNP